MQGDKISFVVFPEGEVDEKSLTVSGERIARERCIAGWLPERYFGNALTGYAAAGLWRKMQKKGFKSFTIKMGTEGPEIDKD